jgi:L-gulono-1,4-lactone dehydrogenase
MKFTFCLLIVLFAFLNVTSCSTSPNQSIIRGSETRDLASDRSGECAQQKTGLCNGTWSNWFKTQSVRPELIASPASAKELVALVKMASDSGRRIRMTGNGHSSSDVAITDDILLTSKSLTYPLIIDCAQLKGKCNSGLVRVQSGIKIADLNSFLNKNGRALINMGGYDGQTLAGVMMTATHGSGLKYGPMTDFVASIQVVGEGGKVFQIEPQDGITNPESFKGFLEEDSSIPLTLIQDDEAFNAIRVSIGSMGIVYAITLKTEKKFWLRESRHRIKWSELKKPDGLLDRALRGLPIYGEDKPSPEHWELQFSPFADVNGDHDFLIVDRYRSYEPLPEQPQSKRGKKGSEFSSKIITLTGAPIAKLMDTFPRLSKFFLKMALNGQVEESFSNLSYKVFNIGVINNTPVLGMEMAFDSAQTVDAIERSFKIAEDLLTRGIPLASPIAVRFVKKSDALIAMQNGRNTTFLEVITLRDGKNASTLITEFQQILNQEFKARPHWGLDLTLLQSESKVKELYPNTWNIWKKQFRTFNPNGTFDGKITDRLGISVRPREKPRLDFSKFPNYQLKPDFAKGYENDPFVLKLPPRNDKLETKKDRHEVFPIMMDGINESISEVKNHIKSANSKKSFHEARLKEMLSVRKQILDRNNDLPDVRKLKAH